MKYRYHLIRHAESAMNVKPHLVGGRSNEAPLTPEGRLQATRLGLFIKNLGIYPDYIVSSNAVRTQQTATISLEAAGIFEDLIIHEGLQEMSQGEWEGVERLGVYTDECLLRIQKELKDFKAPGGESMNDVGRRAILALGDIENEIVQQGIDKPVVDVLVYTHGFTKKCAASTIFGWSHRQTYETVVPNASRTVLEHDGEVWQLTRLAENTQ